MANYQKMYAILCGAVANALERLPFTAENVPARWTLERAMQQAEEIYIRTAEDE